MLTQEQFESKQYVIMNKPNDIIVMAKKPDDHWLIVSTNKSINDKTIEKEVVTKDDAWEYYKERMESYGYRRFTVITKPE